MHSGKLEFLALKWAITEKFHDYLINGQEFEVVTDNNPLTYVLTSAKLHATGLRWVASLANYHFSIRYRAGKKHIDADYLSRDIAEKFRNLRESADGRISEEDISLLLSAATRKEREVDVNLIHVNTIGSDTEEAGENRIGKGKLKMEQEKDKGIDSIYQMVKEKRSATTKELKEMGRETKILHRQIQKLYLEDGVLKRRTAKYVQIVLPEAFRKLVYEELHVKLGHLGPDRVLELAKKRFYWPRMKEDIDRFVNKQCRCLISKKPTNPARAPLKPIVSTYPFEMLTIDYLHLDRAKGGYEYALVCCDHFTKFVQVYATKNKSALAAAGHIYNDFVLKYGMMTRIHHDQGREFDNTLFKRLNQLAGINNSRTTPYHPMSNGTCERFNRTIINMLKALEEKEKSNWPSHLSKLAFAYNVTENSTTGFSPHYLLFGQEPRLPIDSMFAINEESKIRKSYQKYSEEWGHAMKQAFEIARNNKQKAGERNKRYYDRKMRGNELEVGDRVLSRNREKGGTGKLRSFWEKHVYHVVEKVADIPVFVIRPEGGGRSKRVHRNDLLRCNEILSEAEYAERANNSTTNKASQQSTSQHNTTRTNTRAGGGGMSAPPPAIHQLSPTGGTGGGQHDRKRTNKNNNNNNNDINKGKKDRIPMIVSEPVCHLEEIQEESESSSDEEGSYLVTYARRSEQEPNVERDTPEDKPGMEDDSQGMNDSRREAMVSEESAPEPDTADHAGIEESEESTVRYEDEEALVDMEEPPANSVEEINDVESEAEDTAAVPETNNSTHETEVVLLNDVGDDVLDETMDAEDELGLSDTPDGLEELNFTTDHFGTASSVWEEEGSVLLDSLHRRTEPLTSTVEGEVVEKRSLRQSRRNRGIPAPRLGEWTK